MDKGILNGVRVLDFTWMLAGPFATRILADFGAEVIKVQSKKTAKGAESNLGGYFNNWNRNKRSITLDMSYPEAREMVLKLTRISDVIIENFSPRVMANWGLTYDKLKEVKPDLIMASLSGMGQTGSWKDFVAFGPTLQALSGLTYLTSFSEESPLGLGYAHADPIAGLYATYAVLAALEYRDRTGKGQYIDLSEYEAICTFMGPALLNAAVSHDEIKPQGNRPDYIKATPYGCYKCMGTERWCVIAVFDEGEWQALCHVLGDPLWTKEERFFSLSRRKEHGEELDRFLGEWTAQHSAEEIVKLLQGAGVPSGVVQNAEDLVNDPHLLAREFFIPLEHPVLGKTLTDSSPLRFKDKNHPGKDWKAAPLLGEDNEYVYIGLLGLNEREFSSYVQKGIIG
jgi:crotonobetainyl-CoA:carnitine CoA-transferase CaiB-like acyl-CoA transferase